MKHCTLLFLRRDGEILLAMKKRGFGANRFNGVGGKVDADETVEQALIRECQEEIGVTPTNFSKVAEFDFTCDATTSPWHMFVHVFLADNWEGEAKESEEMKPHWFSLTDIPYEQMWQDDIIWLPQVLAGKHLKGAFSFDEQDNMLTKHLEEVRKSELRA